MIEPIGAWVVILFLIFTSAFFVAGEFAIVAARAAHIQKLAQGGNLTARRLLRVLEEPRLLDRYIAASQIGITFSSLTMAAYAQMNVSWMFAWIFVIVFGFSEFTSDLLAALMTLFVISCIQLVFAELLPKAISLRYSNQVALLLYWPLNIATKLFNPCIWLLNVSGNALLKVLSIPVTSHKHIHSLEEIELLLAESKDGGLLAPDEHQRLHQALELSQETAKQLMTPRMKLAAISVSMSIEECYQLALDTPYTRLLVYGDNIDDVRGIVNVKDIIHLKITKENETGFESIVRAVPIVPENLSMDRLIKELKENHSHAAIVMDEYGGTLGIVTVGDIFGELMEETESDEFKHNAKVEVLKDGSVRLPGSYKLRRAAKFIGVFPETEAETVNGLVIEMLGRVPEPGEKVKTKDLSLTVEGVEGNAVTFVVAKRPKRNE